MRRSLPATSALLFALALPALLGTDVVESAAALWRLGGSAHPYWIPGEALRLYLLFPVVAVSACVLFLTPGLLTVQALRAANNVGDWVLRGIAVSIVLVSVAATAVQSILGATLQGRGFALVVVALSAVVFVVALAAGRRDAEMPWDSGDKAVALSLLVMPAALVAVLAPKFLWESLNGDGAHSFEAARRMLYSASPFFSPAAGGMSTYPGLKTFLPSYPISWFVRLFGETEGGARLPFILMLGATYAGLAALLKRPPDAPKADRWLLWGGLAAYTTVMAFDASYEAYHADIALPGVAVTLTVAMGLGLIGATIRGEGRWMAFFVALLYATSPAGLLFAGFWLVAMLLALRPLRIREGAIIVASLLACIAAEKVVPGLMSALGAAPPGTEHATGSLAKRLLALQWREVKRVAYVVLPSGIVPAVMLLAWWRQNQLARALSLLSAAVFVFFYTQQRFAVHFFAPAMILPLAVCWRAAPRSWWFRGAIVAGALIAIVASLPPTTTPWLGTREVGMALEDRTGGYRAGDPLVFKRSELLVALFPPPANPAVPEKSYGGSPLAWNYYANHRDSTVAPAYVLLRPGDPPPAGGFLAKENEAGALYVLDSVALGRHRGIRPGAGGIARVYRLPKSTLFGR
ncbi:MAG: hypothetical protein IT359_02880 [Gemmatimonadaceae bacterium]|nr:hypothetical protein [Gemmatimonadaceae bacterium]